MKIIITYLMFLYMVLKNYIVFIYSNINYIKQKKLNLFKIKKINSK
jgi:hypothetical protein